MTMDSAVLDANIFMSISQMRRAYGAEERCQICGKERMERMGAPCKDCPDRFHLCTMSCEKYAAYKQELELVKKKRRADAAFSIPAVQTQIRAEKFRRGGVR
ncbi:MAG: hypothetical protein MJ116_02830 [Lachnospiraceae bacterium]|nr:hypothetical protein [Lachnospiraceae bacterium]